MRTLLKPSAWFVLVAALTSAFSPLADACSTGQYTWNGKRYAVKALDWDWNHALAFVNPRKLRKTALIPGMSAGTAVWTSKYGSLTLNQLAPEFPYSGMNEKGLIVEILWEDRARNDATAGTRPAVNESQWIQYILDLAATTEEAIQLARDVRYMSMVAKSHYFVCDASGACAVFDFTNGQPLVYAGSTLPIPAVTNDPYANSLTELGRYVPWGGTTEVPIGTEDSIERMARLSLKLASPQVPAGTEAWEFGFDALSTVETSRTAWNIVYEQSDLKIRFKRLGGFASETFDLAALDFSCRNGDRTGRVVNEDAAFSPMTQTRIDAFVSRNAFIPAQYRAALAPWYRTFHCI